MKDEIIDLPNKFPQGTKFKKFGGEDKPYCCAEWTDDQEGVFCMYYEDPPNKKRIPRLEIEAAICHFQKGNIFNRAAFEKRCPTASRNGGCAYAVIVRIIEAYFEVEYAGDGRFITKK